MKESQNSQQEKNDDLIPVSPKTKNTFKDFNKICRAYYDELMHISKSESPSLSQKDIYVLKDIIKEVVDYSNLLLKSNFIQQAKKILDIGLVISDFFLKIFGEMTESGNFKKDNNTKLTDILKYPLSLKLLLLKSNFNILINYEDDYTNGEKNLNEIIEIQLYLKSSNFYIATSKFQMAKIKYFFKNYEDAQKYALDAKNLFENCGNNNNNEQNNVKENNNNKKKEEDEIIEKKISQNVSNILIFLAQIFLIKNDYKNAVSCYENGYYLNLGRYGAENSITEFFKNKLDIVNEEFKKEPSMPLSENQVANNPIIQNNKNIDENSNNNINKNNFIGNIMHKGKADTFCFKIPTSSLYEPFLLSIYSLGSDDDNRYSPELFKGNLCFDKQKLAKYLRLKGTRYNPMFYTDDNLNIILGNITYNNGVLSFLDKNLKTCLISSSCPMKKNNY